VAAGNRTDARSDRDRAATYEDKHGRAEQLCKVFGGLALHICPPPAVGRLGILNASFGPERKRQKTFSVSHNAA
jgi:hypothetical protein